MKKLYIRISSIFTAAALVLSQIPFSANAAFGAGKRESGEVIVMYKPGKSGGFNLPGVKQAGCVSVGAGNNFALVRSDVYSTKQLESLLKKQSSVKYVGENTKFKLTEDENYERYQWALNNSGQQNGKPGADIGAFKIYDSGVTSSDKVVAVLDSGIDASHPDLKNNLWHNEYQRDLLGEYGYDFIYDDITPDDETGHGTHCAGIITAAHDGKGVKGVNSGVKIMALKAFDESGGDMYEIIRAYSYIYRAQTLGVNIVAVNNSWGGECEDESETILMKTIIDLIGSKGAVSVFSAGNDSTDRYDYESIPFDINSDYMINVGATNENGELAGFSNYGDKVDVYAPGTNILSTVSYPSYNPSVYTSERNSGLSDYYTDFESDSSFTDKTENPYGLRMASVGASGEVTVSADHNKYAGEKSETAASVKWSVKGAQKDDVYVLYVPYKALSASGGKSPNYFSCMLDCSAPEVPDDWYYDFFPDYDAVPLLMIDEAELSDVSDKFDIDDESILDGFVMSGSDGYWDHIMTPFTKSIRKDAQRALIFKIRAGVEGDYEINIDDLGISKPVSANNAAAEFGKYDFMSGTSMSAPYVTGAVALAGAYLKNQPAKKLAAYTAGASREIESEKAAGRGTLDLRNIDDPRPRVTECSCDGGSIVIKGDFFGADKGKVFINGDQIAQEKINWSENLVKTDAAGYVNKTSSVLLVTSTGKTFYNKIFLTGKAAAYKKLAEVKDYSEYNKIVSDGSNLYLMDDEYGDFCRYTLSGGKVSSKNLRFPNAAALFPEAIAADNIFNPDMSWDDDWEDWDDWDDEGGEIYISSELVFYDGRIWGIAKYSNIYMNYYKLISYSVNDNKWKAESALPSDKEAVKYGDSSLGVYKGKLYLMGGYSAGADSASDMVRIYDPVTKKWSAGASLPSPRFKSLAFSTGGKLVLIYGGDGKNGVPKTAVFDGKSWAEKSAPPIENSNYMDYLSYDFYDEERDETLHDGYYKAAVGAAKNGLVILTGNCENYGNTIWYNVAADRFTALAYTAKDRSNNTLGASADGKFICLSPKSTMISSSYALSYVPIATECCKVVKKVKNCTISGGTAYFAGDRVTLTVKPDRNCYFKALYINGKKVKGRSYTFAARDAAVIKATAVCGAYVTRVKLNKKSVKLKVGAKIKLKAKITPKRATNKKVSWRSSNKKYASVNKKGVVTALKKGCGKTVKIYAAARDGSKKKAFCKIKIV